MPQSSGTLNSVPQWHTRTRPHALVLRKQVHQLGTKSSACEHKGAIPIRAATEFQVIVCHRWEVTATEA